MQLEKIKWFESGKNDRIDGEVKDGKVYLGRASSVLIFDEKDRDRFIEFVKSL